MTWIRDRDKGRMKRFVVDNMIVVVGFRDRELTKGFENGCVLVVVFFRVLWFVFLNVVVFFFFFF